MKRLVFQFLLIFCVLFIIFPCTVSASETPMSGICGKNGSNIKWKIEATDNSHTLIISGTGEMDDYDGYYSASGYNRNTCSPWHLSKSFEKVIINDGVTSIGSNAFQDCTSLKSVRLPDTLINIGDNAFEDCTGLSDITIPNGVTNIGKSAFFNCKALSDIVIPNGVTVIERCTFAYCKGLTHVTILGSVTRIGSQAFDWCAFSSIVIPDGTISIENIAFESSNLKSVFLPKSVTEVWNNAFRGGLTDIYYEGSRSDWMSSESLASRTIDGDKYDLTGYRTVTANIHFDSVPDDLPEYKVYCNGGYESFDCLVEDCVKKSPSGTYSYVGYNPQLAHMLIAMCNSVYNENDIRTTFHNFGFNNPQYESGDYLTYCFAEKRLKNDEAWILVAIRGTGDFWSKENKNNIFHSWLNSAGEHSGFSNAANELYKKVTKYLESKHIKLNSENTNVVITGFSRGAAVANLLAPKFAKQTGWTWAYTFACPDIGTSFSLKTSMVFNIGNANDFVSWVPGGALNGFSDWGKHGASYWYSDDWNNLINLQMGMSAHNQAKYLEHLRSEKPISDLEYKTRDNAKAILNAATRKRAEKTREEINKKFSQYTHIGIHCPVDVEIYSSDSSLAGRITRGYVSDVNSNKIYAFVDGDEKNIYLLDSDTYTFKLTATDEGTMDYIVQKIRTSDNSVLESKTFANVKLENGKQMTGTVICDNTSPGISDTALYTMDNKGNLQNEIMADGLGTEKPISKVKKIKISGISRKIAAGNKITLKATVSPSNTPNEFIIWKSSNTKYAVVDSRGVVTMKKAGVGKTVTITAMVRDGSNKKASYKIKCMKGVVKQVIISNKSSMKLKAGKSMVLKAKVTASKGANKALKWTSSNTKYASVTNKGMVTAKKAGKGKEVRIAAMATDGSGKRSSVKININ